VEGSEDRCQTSRLKNVERKTGLLTWVARTLTNNDGKLSNGLPLCKGF
jgi:hypothetical protein